MRPETAGERVAHINELLEIIFSNLDFKSLLDAQLVCRTWRTCINETSSTQKLLWKRPETNSAEQNPLFHEPSAAARNLLSQNGSSPLESLQHLTIAYLGSDQASRDRNHYDNQSCKIVKNTEETFGFSIDRLEPAEVCCLICRSWHAQFRYEKLHPLLSFFPTMEVCTKGYGTELLVNFKCWMVDWNHSNSKEGPWPVNLELKNLKLLVARLGRLRQAMKVVQAYNLQEDLFTSPQCTFLAVTNVCPSLSVRNVTGVRLGEALKIITNAYRCCVDATISMLHRKIEDHLVFSPLHRVRPSSDDAWEQDWMDQGDLTRLVQAYDNLSLSAHYMWTERSRRFSGGSQGNEE
ncbi:hypothetical protein BDV95DRAFT_672424 [Massariosphaeria phaeospora]|uniref:F-box domain-containing protein n=1 Tax=Massariosphaeria phaeospora TaxID=100035 RepID=A0A7C8M296_9PLEO|nr:hypothetical protein BDV95DRAFT_672424 [Massariosphaeria phaeospora]